MKRSPVMSTIWVSVFLFVFGLVFFTVGVGIYVGFSRAALAADLPNGDFGRLSLIFLAVFGGVGLLIMLIGIITGRNLGRGRRYKKQLMRLGNYCWAEVTEVDVKTNVHINGRCPIVLRCRYTDPQGQIYIFRSEYLRYDPSEYFPDGKVKLWFDPEDIRKYYVDIEGTLEGRVIEM